jgi:signal transduction histidine kinase
LSFFFDGHFLHSKYKYTDKIFYLFLLIGSPVLILSASRVFVSGWEHIYGVHLAIMLLAALLYFCNSSFNVKAVFLIGTYNLIATGNLVTFHMWGFGSTGYAIGIFLCWLLYDVRLAILNLATTILIIFFHYVGETGIPHEFTQTVTTLDVIVQILGLVVFLMPIILAMNEIRLQQAEAEAKQQEQYEKMKQAEASKTAFLANMSHEIRTPLNATLGSIELLQSTELTEQQLKYINISKTSGKWLRHVIDDVLDIERMRAGALEIEPAWFNSTSLLEEVAIVFEHNAKEAGLHLEVNIGPNVARWLYGDAGKVHQILYNLVGNALKFTEQGTITATLEKLGRGSTYRFTVTDTGIGIPKDRSDDLFEAFTQIDSSLGRKHQGSGLGLAICRHLAQAMGGEIDYQSSQGKGTSFWFDLDFDSEDSVESVRHTRIRYRITLILGIGAKLRPVAQHLTQLPVSMSRFLIKPIVCC